jgi:hypothetical protein
MGRPIVYCDSCGDRILDDEFEKGRAVAVHKKNYCARCAKNVAVPAPAPAPKPKPHDADRPPTAFLHPSPARSPAAHRPHGRPAGGPPMGLIIGAAAGVVGVVVIVLALASSGKGPAPAPPAASKPPVERDDPARRAFEEVEKLASDDPDKILAAVDAAKPKVAGSEYAARLDDIAARARRRKEEFAQRQAFEKVVAELKNLAAADRDFAQYDEFHAIAGRAEGLIAHASGDARDEFMKAQSGYTQAFQQAAAAKADGVRRDAERLAADKRYAEAARAIDAGFTGVWRKSTAWPTLEAKKREYELAATKPPDEGPRPAGRDKFGIALADPPKAGTWVNSLEAAGFQLWARLEQAGEQKNNWRLENGVLTGRSSKDGSGNEGEYADMLITMSNAFADLEVEFTAKAEGGAMLIGARYEPVQGGVPRVAAALLNPSADFTKVRLVIEGGTGKIVVDGQETPMDVSGGAAAGRIIFGLAPGASVTFKELKVLRKK